MKRIRHVGLHHERLLKKQNNPRERAFAKAWSREARETLQALMLVGSAPLTEHPALTAIMNRRRTAYVIDARDAEIVATVIQWLGSNCGMAFLSEALRECGYQIKEIKT